MGPAGYVAPEILTSKGYGLAVDMWSMGVRRERERERESATVSRRKARSEMEGVSARDAGPQVPCLASLSHILLFSLASCAQCPLSCAAAPI